MLQAIPESLNQKPDLIIFDWDNTLADSRAFTVKLLDELLAEHGLEPWDISKKKYRDTSKSLKDNFQNFFGDQAEKAHQTYIQRYLEDYQNHISEIPGARKFLETLFEKNIPFLVISNKDKVMLTPSIEFLFPMVSFLKILGHDDAPQSKPNPDLVFEALKNTQFHPDQNIIWFIGDSIHDVECAYASGCQPILIGKGNSTINAKYLSEKAIQKPSLVHVERYGFLMKHMSLF